MLQPLPYFPPHFAWLLAQVSGAFGVCFIFKDQPDLLIGARRGSPLLLAVGEG